MLTRQRLLNKGASFTYTSCYSIMNQTSTTLTHPHITQDVHCINCGYNLRSLTAKDNCPECGHPTSITLEQPRLSNAPIPYLKRLRRALTLIILTSIFIFFTEVAFPWFQMYAINNNLNIADHVYSVLYLVQTPFIVVFTAAIYLLVAKNQHNLASRRIALVLAITAIAKVLFTLTEVFTLILSFSIHNIIFLIASSFFFHLTVYLTYTCIFLYTSQFSLGSRTNSHAKPLKIISQILLLAMPLIIATHHILRFFFFLSIENGTYTPSNPIITVYVIFEYIYLIPDIFLIGLGFIYLLKLRFNLTYLIKQKNSSVM